jgi:hypothetical protein
MKRGEMKAEHTEMEPKLVLKIETEMSAHIMKRS